MLLWALLLSLLHCHFTLASQGPIAQIVMEGTVEVGDVQAAQLLHSKKLRFNQDDRYGIPGSLADLSKTWHVPMPRWRGHQTARTYDTPLIFMQITPKSIRQAIEERILDYDKDYEAKLRATHDEIMTRRQYTWTQEPYKVRSLMAYPYIRDTAMTPTGACHFLQRITKQDAFIWVAILIDSDEDDDSCIVARWSNGNEFDPFTIQAARVQLSIALPLVSFLSSEIGGLTLEEALGKQEYKEAKVDLGLGYHQGMAYRKQERPLPKQLEDLTFPNDKRITIVSFIPGIHDQIKEKFMSGHEDPDVEVTVLDLHTKCSSRELMYYIHDAMMWNSGTWNTLGVAFFVDDILQDEDGSPKILAASRLNGESLMLLPPWQLQIMPVKPGMAYKLWQASIGGKKALAEDELPEIKQREMKFLNIAKASTIRSCIEIRGYERMIDPRRVYIQEQQEIPTVWYLRNYSKDKEREIRNILSTQGPIDDDDWPNEFMYMGYRFPDDGKTTHTIQELRDLFEKSDPMSPFFEANTAQLAMAEYPPHFIAVDDAIFNEDDRKVQMASTIDFGHDNHHLGWTSGTHEATDAHLIWVNFDIANVGADEGLDDTERLWLSDLTDFRAKAEGVEYLYEFDDY